MAIQLNDTLRNNMISQYETTVGASPKLILRTGAPPANAAADDTGTFLAIITLPADWLTAPATGSVSINGSWAGVGSAAGTAEHYRLKSNAATSTDNSGTTYEQGTVAIGSGDLSVDNNVIAISQAFSVTAWTRTQGGV